MKLIKQLLFLLLLTLSCSLYAKPNIQTIYDKDNQGFTRIKVINKSARTLICYVAIDGHKIKFKLLRAAQSKWYKATDKRFTAKNFSVWCDFIELHPQYN